MSKKSRPAPARTAAQKATATARSVNARQRRAEAEQAKADDFAPAAPEPDVTGMVAERQRVQIHQAILNEAEQVIDEALQVGMGMMQGEPPEHIVGALYPYVVEAERIRATAARFSPNGSD